MTHTITISIVDPDRYFAQGLELLLRHYFALRGVPVRFISGRASQHASLLFQRSKANGSTKFCWHRASTDRQRVIIMQDASHVSFNHKRPVCLSEVSIINRSAKVSVFLLEAVLVLAASPITAPTEKCLRCANRLTHREYQILSAIKRGKQCWQIALQLNLSPKTVSTHKRNAMKKLGFNRNTELYYWLQNDVLDYEIREYL